MRILVAAFLLATGAQAAPAQRVYAGVYLHDVTKFDQRDGVFDVDLELWAKWLGDFNPELLGLANAAGDLHRDVIGQEADGEWHSARWRVRGTLRGEFPLQRFPFDSQTLSVNLELPVTIAELTPDLAASGIRSHFSITGWIYEPEFRPRVTREVYRSDLGSLANEGRPTLVNRVSFEVALHRPLLMVALKLFLPLVIILMVAMLGLFLHPELVEARASLGVTALLSCFAFQFTIAGTLPDVAYLTIADGLFLVAYIITLAALVASISSYFLHRRGHEKGALRFDRIARVMLPLFTLVPAILFIRAPVTVVLPPMREALPKMERPHSARDRVRVGTLSLPTIMASPVTPGIFWDVVHKEPDGKKNAIYADTTASVASDTLRFLSSGELEVTWRLRPDSRWSDGTPLAARDLQFATEVSKDPELLEARVISPHELVMHYSDRIADALEGPMPYPAHALQAAFAKGGYAAVREARQKTVLPSLGPYHVVSFSPEEKLVLAPNPRFIGPPPSIANIEVIHYKDSAEAVAAFEKGEVDILAPNTPTPEDTRALKLRRPDAVHIRPSNAFIFLAPDLNNPLLQKRSVRRALLLAIDRERLKREIYGEDARVADVPIPGALPKGVTPAHFDPAQAKLLLEQAGAAGMELPITHGPSAVDKRIAEHVAADLAAVGLKTSLKQVARVADVYRDRAFTGLIEHSLRGTRDLGVRAFWNLPVKDGRYVPTARHDAYDDTMALWIDRERRALYPERREQLRDLIYAAYAERLPTVPLVFAAERMVADPALHGWDNGPQARFGEALERWAWGETSK